MRQIALLELPPRADRTEMTHYLRPPFPQIPPDDMLNIIDTATQWNQHYNQSIMNHHIRTRISLVKSRPPPLVMHLLLTLLE